MDALNKKTIEDIDVKGKKVLARCDFNVPLKDGEITNDKRIVAALPTIKYLMEHGAKVILCSHLGRPKGEYKPEFSLAPVAKRLSEYLGVEVKLAEDAEVVGPNAKAMAAELKDGEVMLLDAANRHIWQQTAVCCLPDVIKSDGRRGFGSRGKNRPDTNVIDQIAQIICCLQLLEVMG